MRKDLKKVLLEHNYHLYSEKWVEETATQGFERCMQALKQREPQIAASMDKILWIFEVMYYTAFEDALNTFYLEVLKDDVSKIELYMDEMSEITAKILKHGKG